MKKGFTLVEIIIVIGIFSIVSIISLDTYINGFRNEQKSALQNKVMQDARIIMNLISEEIKQSEVDYNEYFNQCIILGACPTIDANYSSVANFDSLYYGQNHGYYDWQFFHGGYSNVSRTSAEDGFGSLCQNNSNQIFRFPNTECVSGPLAFSEDSNTGTNPAIDNLEELGAVDEASAFCANDNYKLFSTSNNLSEGVLRSGSMKECITGTPRIFSELYLINPTKNKKVIVGKGNIGIGEEKMNYAVKMIELDPLDAEVTRNVIYPVNLYTCSDGYTCTDSTSRIVTTSDAAAIGQLEQPVPALKRNALYVTNSNIFENFVPISPLSVNIVDLQFIITPSEDPFKGYRESNLEHPKVTIILEVEPSTRFRVPFFSSNFNLRLQTTVATI